MKKVLFFALFLGFLFPSRAFLQTTDCFSVSTGIGSGQPDSTVCLPLTVDQFSSVAAIQFSVRWNPGVLEFSELQNGALPGISAQSYNVQQGAGVLNFLWYDAGFTGVSLPNGSAIFNLCFKIVGEVGDFSPVFVSNSPVTTEFVNASGQAFSPNFMQGGISVLATGQQPNSPIFVKGCVQNIACAGPNGAIDITVGGGQPPFSYLWTGPNTFLATTDDLTGLLPGLYKLTVQDGSGFSQKAEFLIESTTIPGFSVDLTATPATCPVKNDGEILLEITGSGTAPITFLWSNDSTAQNLAGIEAGDYEVSVTDAAGCQISQKITVDETPGFEVELVFDHPNCLTGDALGGISVVPTATTGSAPFSFLWSTGATDSLISGVAAGNYSVTVTEAGGCSAVFFGEISDDLLVDWQVSLATICEVGSALGSIEASLILNSGGAAPFLFEWSNGFSETVTPSVGNFPKSTLTGSLSGIYDLKISDANGCDFTQKDILLDCDLPLNAKVSCFNLEGGSVAAPDGQVVCVPFFAQNLDSLLAMQFALSWDTSKLVFDHENIVLTGPLSSAATSWLPTAPGELRYVWYSGTSLPQSVADGTVFLEACFLPKGTVGEETEVKFTELPTFPIEISKYQNNYLPFSGQNARVKFGPDAPSDLRLETCTLLPDCAADALADINLTVTGGTTPYVYEWSGPNFFAATQDVFQLTAGIYGLTVTDAAGFSTSAHIEIKPVNPAGIDCVWPGDADDNASANHFDLLTMGLGMGHIGPARPTTGLLWTGYSAPGWGDATPVSGINFRNLDADGNGIIEPADVDALAANWGETIFPTAIDPNLQLPDNQGVNAQNGPAVMLIPSDTLEAGEAAAVPILLGLSGAPAVDLLAVAFSIFYDTALIKKTSVSFQPTGSWLGTAGSDLVFVQKNFPEKGRLDVALSRTDGQNLTGEGELGLAYIVIEDDIYFRDGHGDDHVSRGPTDTIVPISFQIKNVRGITATERLLDLQPKDAPFFLRQEIVGTGEAVDISKKIIAYPNPVFGEVNLQSSIFMENMAIFGADGRLFSKIEIGARAASFSMDGLPSGFYFLKIQTSAGVAVKKVFKN